MISAAIQSQSHSWTLPSSSLHSRKEGHQTANTLPHTVRQQIQASVFPKSHDSTTHFTPTVLVKSNSEQQGQAIRLSISLGNQPFGVAAVGKPSSVDLDVQEPKMDLCSSHHSI
jgi:hypothetical protein